ncbi:MAG: YggS family pyridoxal phosphate-dependent enzyme [Terriglobales bacterium]
MASPVMPLQQKGMSVADNLARIRQAIGSAPVKLIAVTKTASPSQIEEAFKYGVTEFGENRVQDALDRRRLLPPNVAAASNWHFIGHLQTNKVKQAIDAFALIHSVDSLRLAQEISRAAGKAEKIQPILLQVKLVADDNKSGFSVAELKAAFPALLNLPNLRLEGLMTIAPFTDDRFIWRRCFAGLKELRDALAREHKVELKELSMGMTGDWQEAIECGATMIRLGRAIFDG